MNISAYVEERVELGVLLCLCGSTNSVRREGGEYTWNDSHGDADYEHGDDYFDDYADDVDDDGDDDGDVDW